MCLVACSANVLFSVPTARDNKLAVPLCVLWVFGLNMFKLLNVHS